jgi:hypothetical protein
MGKFIALLATIGGVLVTRALLYNTSMVWLVIGGGFLAASMVLLILALRKV